SQCISVIASLLEQDGKNSIYINSFASVILPSIEEVLKTELKSRTRLIRKIQIYWAILHRAGFTPDEKRLRGLGLTSKHTKHFNPHFNKDVRKAVYKKQNEKDLPDHPDSLDSLTRELETIANFFHDKKNI
ncbi:hypothetical protein RCF13_00945, partial [Stenotrophomonas maltophilia group sp. RNC7]|nr:hypothetical protein [Stenotrophomonas maltophilia group sp. RNC7]